MSVKKWSVVLGVVVILSMLLSACAAPTPQVVEKVVTQVVTQEKIVEKPVDKIVEKIVEKQVVVTPTPAPVKYVAPHPDTYTWVTYGDVDTLDPALAYDTASAAVIMNVSEGLIWFNKSDATSYIPILATEVPSAANGGISADGKTYTFKIRKGVKFHDGAALTPSDFEYSFERGLLQSDPNGPQWLLLEPLLGYMSGDVTESIKEAEYAGDPDALKKNATAAELKAVCEKVKATVEADDTAFTLKFNLAQPWGPFLATLAQSWGAAVDKDWAVKQGDWDGSCDTWQNFYAPGAEKSKLTDKINGTGPYKLDKWTPGEGWVLVANDAYWRADTDPMWKDGPAGKPKLKRVVQKLVNEWGTRFSILQAGDAEVVTVPTANRPQVDAFVGETCDFRTGECKPTANPKGALRKWGGLPSVDRTDIFLTFNVGVDAAGNNPYIGSGKLDGNGIPPDFFSDIHVRLAMNYCFDYKAYISDALNGEGVRNNGPIILDMLGYNPKGEMYEFDLKKCEAELAQAWGGKLPEVGFRFQAVFNTGNVTRQTIAAILQTNLLSINPKYQVEIVGLPWPTMLRSFRAAQLPVVASGWVEDIHDPHNWVQPFTVGTYAGRQAMPKELKAQFQDLVNKGVAASDPKQREQIYFELQKLHHAQAPQVTLAQSTGVRYEQRWVKDWYYNPLLFAGYFYAYSLADK